MSNARTEIMEADRTTRWNATESASGTTCAAAGFHSILFERPEDRSSDDGLESPAFFADLNCDRLVNAIIDGREEYNLRPFFNTCLRRLGAIHYRQEVMRDFENDQLIERVTSFSRKMRFMRAYLSRAHAIHYKPQREAWFLDAVRIYCDAVASLADDLRGAALKSHGFAIFRDYVTNYIGTSYFRSLALETKRLGQLLSTVKYSVLIKANGFTVRKYAGGSDYSEEVEKTFEKFKQGAVEDYEKAFPTHDEMNHVEAKILEFVARLYPHVFEPLEDYCARNDDFMDESIKTFDREVQFYLAYVDYTAVLRRTGLQFCYPVVSDDKREVHCRDGFDSALASKLIRENVCVVCNDFYLKGEERILVVSGPNQGGKTTFARMFGQLHYLANIGCPVPGSEAQLLLFDKMFTHFEKEEKVEMHRGKLEDDLIRIRDVIRRATPRSIIIMNEIFTSTTLHDETYLSRKVMQRIIALDLLCVWVTFVDELATFGPQTISMVSTVVPDNPTLRTFKIVRRSADGLAYAVAIAQKYRLTYDAIKERIGP